MTKRQEYVCGFLFNGDDEQITFNDELPMCGDILLVHKKYGPEEVVGLWNGIGGKIEKDESPIDAMYRECKEETGIDDSNDPIEWRAYCQLKGDTWGVTFFVAWTFGKLIHKAKNDVGEEQRFWPIEDIMLPTKEPFIVPNLYWLLPMAGIGVNWAEVEDLSMVDLEMWSLPDQK